MVRKNSNPHTVNTQNSNNKTTDSEELDTAKQLFNGADSTAGVGWAQDLIITSNGEYWDVSDSVGDGEAGTKLQTALDSIGVGGWVLAPPRLYRQDLVFGNTDTPQRSLFGYGRQNAELVGDTSTGLTVELGRAYRGYIANFSIRTPTSSTQDAVSINDNGSGAANNFKIENCRVTESGADAWRIENGVSEVYLYGIESSGSSDIGGRQFYCDGTEVIARKNQHRLASAPSSPNIVLGPNAERNDLDIYAGDSPIVEINRDTASGSGYNYLDLGASKGVDLTFSSTTDGSTVVAQRFSSVTNNGGTTNTAWEWRSASDLA